mgnify:CR=1 FL=1
MQPVEEIEERVGAIAPTFEAARGEIARVLVGQRYMVDRLLIGLLANGHVLLEGVPGLAKTTAVKALANALALDFSRIQFTPDLLPADVVGTQIYQPQHGDFTTRKGPIFANIVLADEVNRSPAKVQAALLEAMQERQVTLGETTFPLPGPFLVLATQNPIDQEGTYPLPEAQVDRFMLKLRVTYPTREEERQVMDRMASGERPTVDPVVGPEELLKARSVVDQVYVDDKVKEYILSVVFATREPARAGLAELAKRGLSYDVSLFHHQLSELADAARALPELTIVLNHCGHALGVGPYADKREEVWETWHSECKKVQEGFNNIK